MCFENDIDLGDFDFLDLELDKPKSDSYLNEIECYIDKNIQSLVKYIFPEYYRFFPINYWKRILYTQIFHTISLIFKIEALFDKIAKQNIKFKVRVLNENQIYPIEGHGLTIRLINGFNLFKLTSLILHKKQLKHIELKSHITKPQPEINKNSVGFSLNEIVLNIIQFFSKNVVIGYGINLFDAIYLNYKLPIKKKPKSNQPIYLSENSKNNIDWRYDIIRDLISPKLKESISKYYKLNNEGKLKFDYKIKLVQNSIYQDFDELILSNISSLFGKIIITSQHGGDLFSNNDLFKKNVERNYDFFISWKEYLDDKKNILKLPSPLFSKAFNTFKQRNNRIILVATQALKFNVGFDGWFINSKDAINYRSSKINLINFLLSKERGNFYYRHYPFYSETSLEDSVFFQKKFPELQIINSKLHKEIKNCKLLILDHPGTTLSLALSINVPIMLYVENKKHFGIDENSALIRDMLKLKILLIDFEKFTSQYEKIKCDPKTWWNSESIQKFRKSFFKNNAFIDKKWKEKWIINLNEI
tara:strand:+ start:175 stop:1767 length:1593 start_codon:yes stop_codon:yes gene_type:complete